MNGRIIKEVGSRPNTVIIEARENGGLRLRFFLYGKNVRCTLEGVRVRDPSGRPQTEHTYRTPRTPTSDAARAVETTAWGALAHG